MLASPFRLVYGRQLMDILSDEEASNAITWDSDGFCFAVLKPKKFTEDTLPRYMKKCKYKSFIRKLYRWGFRQFTSGDNTQCFYHRVSPYQGNLIFWHQCSAGHCYLKMQSMILHFFILILTDVSAWQQVSLHADALP